MFNKLIDEEKLVNIYYGDEQMCISGVITAYYERYDLIRISTQGIILPVKCITKIEIVEDPFRNILLVERQVLKHDVDFDNARYLALPVSVWLDGQRIHEPDELAWHDAEHVQIGRVIFDKRPHTFIVEAQ